MTSESTETSPLSEARRVAVKIGSALLVDPETGLREAWLAGLAEDLSALRRAGKDVLIVSSGAIALGRRELGLPPGDLALEAAQAAAAVGQIALARAYSEALGARGVRAAQVLMTLGDTQDRRRYLNGCATLKTLLELGVAPIVNENDTVATDEIRYGDNDRLAARVALMADADCLLLLSDVDGLYSADPRRDPAARRLQVVTAVTPELEAMAGGAGTPGAKGGMATKLMAAKTAAAGGCAMAIARGAPSDAQEGGGWGRYAERPLTALLEGAPCTWFMAASDPQAARKRWIAGMKPMGALVVDAGAAAALTRGKSLLPAGVSAVEGVFERGDPVAVRAADGATLGAALSSYSAADARLIAGRRSDEISAILGYPPRSAMAHRDDMALWA